jgi:chromosome segregation protein
VYLKSLTLKGFKSFASSTTLHFEPGITCVVGPNGSGKSNVVDALAWVMGEQGAKSLRGGKMEDVIFAGTAGRPPLGRAEVVLTIDNADGALPIEYSEVTISRTMFRNGGSEYAINGTSCRLLDVQELLSDSGIGREMHVIVGQGQLDTILHATPEDRRGFIEEAAGVLKHRKRKEKALRKLDSTEGNLTRLTDLISEIRRQLKPLGRQAEVARKAAGVQAAVRDAKARLLADDLVTSRAALEQELADESVLVARRVELEQMTAAKQQHEATLEAALREELPALSRAQETWFALSSSRERLRGMKSLALERVRNAAGAREQVIHSGRSPEELELEATKLREEETSIGEEVAANQQKLNEAIQQRKLAEEAAASEDQRVSGLLRAAADRREGLARLQGQVNALKSRANAAEQELARLSAAREEAASRLATAEHDFTALETRVAGLDAGEEGLDAEHEVAISLRDDLAATLSQLQAEVVTAERERGVLAARKEALELGLNRKDGAGALLAATDQVAGLLGSIAALLTVRSGYEAAISAALGSAADAVAVRDSDVAVSALAHLKNQDLGRAGLIFPGSKASSDQDWPGLPESAIYAIDVVECPEDLREPLVRLLYKTAIVDDLAAAGMLVAGAPDVVAVTQEGDILGAHFATGGSSSQPTLIEIQAAVDEASQQLTEAISASERLKFETSRVEREHQEAHDRVEVAMARLHESDAALAALAEELAGYGSAARAARGEATRLEQTITGAEQARDADLAGLADLELRLASAQEAPEDEPDTTVREALAEAARTERQKEMDARLALRTAEERARALHGRAEQLERTAHTERDSRRKAEARRVRLIAEGDRAQAVESAITQVLAQLETSLESAAGQRAAIEKSRGESEAQLREVRARLRELARELEDLVNSVHRDELARTQQRMRIDQLSEKALAELGLDVDSLVAEYGPDQLVPFLGPVPEGEVAPEPEVFDRGQQQKRLRAAERDLSMLGRVNPLALEEFTAMEERHRFLSEQLEDLKNTRKDLLDIVRDVDARVEQVFTEAFVDVEQEFAVTFARLFPGGEGRLVLTNPDDMLTTGVDVEARPPGKKVKRLSLLSGGERSLVAVAFLVALFKARPSPFYILDEVEAALDDTNLGRLLEIYEELRESSQLLVITHQKRTMEVGDALYGVTMRGDGVSTVISQRLREAESA